MVIVHQNTEITKILLKTEVVQFRRRGFQPSIFFLTLRILRCAIALFQLLDSFFKGFNMFSHFGESFDDHITFTHTLYGERWCAEIRFITRDVIDNPRISANGDVIPNLDMSNNPSAACDGYVFSNLG